MWAPELNTHGRQKLAPMLVQIWRPCAENGAGFLAQIPGSITRLESSAPNKIYQERWILALESSPESGPGILPSFAVKMTMDMAAGLKLAVAMLASKNIQFRYNAHPATATVD